MLDTVILTIPKGSYRISDSRRFKPSSDILLKNPNLFLVKCMNNPTESDKKGFYHPRMTLMRRPSNTHIENMPLRVEFSAPKMLFQNNVDELEEKDFSELVATLKFRMEQMGVKVGLQAIKDAKVSAFHASKNIALKHGYTTRYVLGEISKVNINRKLDMDKAQFRNGGKALTCYAKSNSFVMYDKVKDITQQNGRNIDQDQTQYQLQLFKTPNKGLEILRLEVRLSNRTKLKSTLNDLGYEQDPTFEYIFNNELCQKIIESYWHRIVNEKYYFLFDTGNKPQKILQKIITNLDVKPKQAIYLAGLKMICKDADGITGLRQCLEKNCSNKTWNRITKDFNLLNTINIKSDYQEWLQQIEDELKHFPALKLVNCDVKNSKVY